MIDIADLPHVNAAFNGLTMVFLGFGYAYIRAGRREAHRACMIAALVASAAFLVTYLTYHFNSGLARFGGEGIVRPFYFTLLIVHVILSVAIVPLVPMTVFRALTGRFERHRRIARVTWPLWMTVAVTGVMVYVMAIHLYPYAGAAAGGG